MDDMFNQLEVLIQERRQKPVAGSYTSHLFARGRSKMAQKVGEEAVEVLVAALGQGRDEQIEELADLFYHTLVLMAELELTLDDVRQKLRERHQPRP